MRPLRRLPAALAGALMVTALLVPAAQAAFPGRNGLLVVAPRAGGGLVLIGVQGKNRQSICTDPQLCGSPSTPRFSPDGRDIVFTDAHTSTPVIVAGDGTCMWCLLGPPLASQHGTRGAFTSDGQAVSFVTAKGLSQAALGGGLETARPGQLSDAVWSVRGALAYVSGGSIWVVPRGGTPRMLAAGRSPSFSPDGGRLAFQSGRYVWIASLAGGLPRRFTRGSSPAFSPDGRQVAVLSRSGQVFIVSARGGRPRLVPGVRASAVDWQPLASAPSQPCAVPPGFQLVSQTPEAVITQNRATPLTPWYGCLLATGQRVPLVHLNKAGQGFTTTLTQIELAGRFAALATTATDTAGHCSNAVTQVDLAAGSARQLYTQNCAKNQKTVDSLALDTSGFTAWHATEQVLSAQPLVGLACPSSSLCVGADGLGNVFATGAPPSGPWSSVKVAPTLSRIVCPTAQLCIGLDGGDIVTSTNPVGGAAAWSAPQIVDSWPISDVACPSSDLCVAVDAEGNVLSSTDPTGGPSAWTLANIDGTNALSGVSCPASDLCVAVGRHGDVLTSSDPAGGAATWTRSSAETSGADLTGVACPASDLCVALDTAGNVLTTTTPTAGLPWSASAISGLASTGTSNEPVCPRRDLCLVRNAAGDVFTSSNPTGGQSAWSPAHLVDPPNSLVSLTCDADGTLCAAGDANGNVLSATNPTAGAVAWTSTPVDVPPCTPCRAEQVYASDDRATQALDTAQPGPGNVLGGVALAGNSTTVGWTHAGSTQSAGLS